MMQQIIANLRACGSTWQVIAEEANAQGHDTRQAVLVANRFGLLYVSTVGQLHAVDCRALGISSQTITHVARSQKTAKEEGSRQFDVSPYVPRAEGMGFEAEGKTDANTANITPCDGLPKLGAAPALHPMVADCLDLAQVVSDDRCSDPNLDRLVRVWPRLSLQLRKVVMAVVDSAMQPGSTI